MLLSPSLKDKKKPIPPPKQPEGKRIRRERNELEDIVFKLFERQPNWTLKQLVQETDQPVVSIADRIPWCSPCCKLCPVRIKHEICSLCTFLSLLCLKQLSLDSEVPNCD